MKICQWVATQKSFKNTNANWMFLDYNPLKTCFRGCFRNNMHMHSTSEKNWIAISDKLSIIKCDKKTGVEKMKDVDKVHNLTQHI